MADFVSWEKQTSLVIPEKIAKIVNNNFEQSLCVEWAKRRIKLKAESKAAFVSTDVCQNLQTSYGAKKPLLNSVPGAKNWSFYTGQ